MNNLYMFVRAFILSSTQAAAFIYCLQDSHIVPVGQHRQRRQVRICAFRSLSRTDDLRRSLRILDSFIKEDVSTLLNETEKGFLSRSSPRSGRK